MRMRIAIGMFVLVSGLCVFGSSSGAGADGAASVAASAEDTRPLAVGDEIPAVVIQNSKGEPVDLRALVGQKRTALIFYRGGWCPFCNKHLKEVAEAKDQIVQSGYQIVAINADRPEDVAIAEGKNNFPFLILSDSDLKAATAFGLAFKLDDDTVKKYTDFKIKLEDSSGKPRYSLPVPAFYLIDTDGKVTFEFHDPDYKVRISKDALLSAIKNN